MATQGASSSSHRDRTLEQSSVVYHLVIDHIPIFDQDATNESLVAYIWICIKTSIFVIVTV
jgi:hypothetical protein